MSSGTSIIQKALRKIGAFSPVLPSQEDSTIIGRDALNAMLQQWLSEGIDLGIPPLDAPGNELNEPRDSTNAIVNNLALELAPDFNVNPSLRLITNAQRDFAAIKRLYQKLTIPDKVVSSTLPRGAGNQRVFSRVYAGRGATIASEDA